MVVLGLSPYQGRELVFWAVLIGVLLWAAGRAVRWFLLRYAQHTRWGRRSRTRQGLRRARDGVLERYARGEITEDEYRERLRILEHEGRTGP